MATYIQKLPDWPGFRWDQGGLAKPRAAVRLRQGRLIGRMQALEFRQQKEAVLATLTEDVLKSSEIEGESLDKDQVRSSIAPGSGWRPALCRPPIATSRARWARIEKCSPEGQFRYCTDAK
jgi:Fic family protein